jgi:LAO/AO transport system kinase
MDEKHLQDWLNKRKERRKSLTPESLFDGVLKQDVGSLSAAITLLESARKEDQLLANELIKLCLPHSGKSIRVGITGVPGVGKSTFIEQLGKHVLLENKRVAVLAIDPSSEISGGSILGDKTRMEELSMLEHVFIRPSPAGKTLGGVARKTRESILLCEAAGFDLILIETVGVGQSETAVHSMVDFFLLLMLSGAGDELQGIKRGIMEMADALVITKADGDNIDKAQRARNEYKNAMHLFPPNPNGWTPKAMVCSSLENRNIQDVWSTIMSYDNHTKVNGFFQKKRQSQDIYWFQETLKEYVLNDFFQTEGIKKGISELEELILKGKISSFQAAEDIFKKKVDGGK